MLVKMIEAEYQSGFDAGVASAASKEDLAREYQRGREDCRREILAAADVVRGKMFDGLVPKTADRSDLDRKAAEPITHDQSHKPIAKSIEEVEKPSQEPVKPVEATKVAPEPEKRTTEPRRAEERHSEPELTGQKVPPLAPVTSTEAPKGNRPAGLPSNLAMAVAAIQAIGPTGSAGIRNWCRKTYWPEMPDAWSASLYDLVNAGKLRRIGINFDVPFPPVGAAKPEKPTPQERINAEVAKRQAPKPSPVDRRPSADVRFIHGDRSTLLRSSREYLLAGKLRVAMGKGHLSEAFLANTVLGSNTEHNRVIVKSITLGMNEALAEVGLKVEYYEGFGFVMKEVG